MALGTQTTDRWTFLWQNYPIVNVVRLQIMLRALSCLLLRQAGKIECDDD